MANEGIIIQSLNGLVVPVEYAIEDWGGHRENGKGIGETYGDVGVWLKSAHARKERVTGAWETTRRCYEVFRACPTLGNMSWNHDRILLGEWHDLDTGITAISFSGFAMGYNGISYDCGDKSKPYPQLVVESWQVKVPDVRDLDVYTVEPGFYQQEFWFKEQVDLKVAAMFRFYRREIERKRDGLLPVSVRQMQLQGKVDIMDYVRQYGLCRDHSLPIIGRDINGEDLHNGGKYPEMALCDRCKCHDYSCAMRSPEAGEYVGESLCSQCYLISEHGFSNWPTPKLK